MVHVAVVLSRHLLERLRNDAKASDRGLSAEIRQRLQGSYGVDEQTAELIECIKLLANSLESDMGEQWSDHAYVQEAFKAGVLLLIDHWLPMHGSAHERPDTEDDPDKPPDDPPAVVGRTHARFVLNEREKIIEGR
jgi:hypothetical protein